MDFTSPEWNDLPPLEKAASLFEAGTQARTEGHAQTACGYYIQALNLYRGHDDRRCVARTLLRLADLAGWTEFGDGLDGQARRQVLASEALAIYRELGDRSGEAWALLKLATASSTENPVAMMERALAIFREAEDLNGGAEALSSLANRLWLSGEPERARDYNLEALRLYREIDELGGVARVLFSLAIHARGEEKLALVEEALAIRRGRGEKRRIVELILLVAREVNDLDRREALWTEGAQLCREMGNVIWGSSCANGLAEIARARGDEDRAMQLEAESRALYAAPPGLQAAFQTVLEQAVETRDYKTAEHALRRLLGN